MDPWYKIALPRREVREGRSFDPNEFAIALEQVVAGTAPADYSDPEKFFARTYFTRALAEHAGTVLRRLAGETVNAAPVLSFITQFGGGKTHTLTALYHLARNGPKAAAFAGIPELLAGQNLTAVPAAKAGVFVGNAWDPREGSETPWLHLARQIAGDAGVKALGPAARTTAPGTESLGALFAAAGGPVLLLMDEVLNFLNRHRDLADGFYSFVQNLTVATAGTPKVAAVLSLPKSQVEMNPWEQDWQARITKVVKRVAKDLIANDEAEVSEVVRRRLFEDIGHEKARKPVAKAYADWCFERRAQLPPEWTSVDTAATEAKAREALRQRFEACYPFHPATLSVFQRKWQTLPQYQQTRGTLAMLAQWLSKSYLREHQTAGREPLVTLGSAPLDDRDFRAAILGQLGEPRLGAAIETDISGDHSHAGALDADTRGALRGIHRRVGAAVLFECSGGQTDKIAHLPDLRFALGGPGVDTASIDVAVAKLETRAFFIRRAGTDGFRIGPKAKLNKVMADRRASLDEENEVKPAQRRLVKELFERGAAVPVIAFPEDGTAVQDMSRLALVVMDPAVEWDGNGAVRERIAEWTKRRGNSARLYPASIVWCLRKAGRTLAERVEILLAWQRVAKDIVEGTLGQDVEADDRREVQAKLKGAEEEARDAVWADYRFVVFADSREPGGIKSTDLGAGHSSAAETLSGRVVTALKQQGLLGEAVGPGYVERHWPPALKVAGAWPLTGLRQSFLDGSLTRLLDPDRALRTKIPEWVESGEFGFASGPREGGYDRVWFAEPVAPEDVSFEPGVFLLTKTKAQELKRGPEIGPEPVPPGPQPVPPIEPGVPGTEPGREPGSQFVTLRIAGAVPPEQWNRLGTRLISKLRQGSALTLNVTFSATVDRAQAASLNADLKQALADLGLENALIVSEEGK